MNILGFMGWASHDPAACILKIKADGSFDCCTISEERLNRVKYSYHFPIRSIKYCLDTLEIPSLDDIDIVINDWSQNKESYGSNDSFRRLEYDYIRENLKIDKSKIQLIDSHHLAHAYSTFVPSGFNEAAILIVDAIGSNLEGCSIYHGKGTKIELIESSDSFSLGKLYDAVTRDILGFRVGEDGKTMGLAAFGEKYAHEPSILKINGQYEGASIDLSNFMTRIPDSRILNSDIKKCNSKNDLYDPYFSKIAFEVQDETEKAMLHLAKYVKEKTGCNNLCIAGGVGLNCVANERIKKAGLFNKIFIQPASSDAGIPYGLALYGYYKNVDKVKHRPTFKNAFMGRTYSEKVIIDLLEKFNIPYKKTTPEKVAKLIAERNIIAWFTGGSEFGPRALGHRSIIADPRHAEIKEILNEKVKHRELYRPFAPSIMVEFGDDYFELDGYESPFMLLAPKFRSNKMDTIPAVVHEDGTGRVQTVSKDNSQEYYTLISKFNDITGVPVVLNTSFNDNNEPIVETPLDSLLCFLRTKIDFLVLNSNVIVTKADILNYQEKIKILKEYRENNLKAEYKLLLKTFLEKYSVPNLKNYLILNSNLSSYYKKFKAYEKLKNFLIKHKSINYIGDTFHFYLVNRIIKTQFNETTLQDVAFVEDKMVSSRKLKKSISDITNKQPIVFGFYNLSEVLKDEFEKRKDVCVIYEKYQMHLENVINKDEIEGIDFEGIEKYSCEFAMSKDFDTMFLED